MVASPQVATVEDAATNDMIQTSAEDFAKRMLVEEDTLERMDIDAEEPLEVDEERDTELAPRSGNFQRVRHLHLHMHHRDTAVRRR